MLHSFYCWGQAGVVLLSTLYFVTIGSENWRWLPVIWALFPLLNMFLFMKVPINELIAEDETPTPLKELFGMKIFYVLMLLMICAGASELAMSQWSYRATAAHSPKDFLQLSYSPQQCSYLCLC